MRKSDLIIAGMVQERSVVARRLGKPIFAVSDFAWHYFFERLGPGLESRFREVLASKISLPFTVIMEATKVG